MIIVSNKQRLQQHKAPNRKLKITVRVILFLATLTLILLIPALRYLAAMSVLPLIGIIALFIRPKTYFECYTDEFQAVHILFMDDTEQNRSRATRSIFSKGIPSREEHLVIQPGTLWGYESHSFISKKQQLICLLLRTREGMIRTRPIPVEYLNEAEKVLFYRFLDQLIAHNKSIGIQGSPMQPSLN